MRHRSRSRSRRPSPSNNDDRHYGRPEPGYSENTVKDDEYWNRKRLLRQERVKLSRPVWSRSPSPPPKIKKILEDMKNGIISVSKLPEAHNSENAAEIILEPEQKTQTEAEPLPSIAGPITNADEDEIEAELFRKAVQGNSAEVEEGPQLPPTKLQDPTKRSSYGESLLPGEGAAIAQFVQAGKRIPRRGEVGWNSDEISSMEDLGYVMSGSRHTVMNAVRLRKENQVYSAEEKRALSLISYQEMIDKEHAIINQVKTTLKEKMLS